MNRRDQLARETSRDRVELSEHFGPIRDPFGVVAVGMPSIDAAVMIERLRSAGSGSTQ